MHTSASAMRSSLPATDLLDNDTRKAQLQRERMWRSLRLLLSLPHSLSGSLPPSCPVFIMRVNTMAHSLCLIGSFLKLQKSRVRVT